MLFCLTVYYPPILEELTTVKPCYTVGFQGHILHLRYNEISILKYR